MCFMNDSDEPVLIFEQKGKARNVIHKKYYEVIVKGAENEC